MEKQNKWYTLLKTSQNFLFYVLKGRVNGPQTSSVGWNRQNGGEENNIPGAWLGFRESKCDMEKGVFGC